MQSADQRPVLVAPDSFKGTFSAPQVATAIGIGDDEQVLGLLHLGTPRQDQRTPERAPVHDVVEYLE